MKQTTELKLDILRHPPLVSILINNYNYGHFLSEAIDSALAQTYEQCEVIVVDDGSTDNSREIIESYGNRVISVQKDNGGQASAFNAGFAVSRGDIICFLDSDDIFLPEKVTEIVRLFIHYPDIDWCFHPLHYVNDCMEYSTDSDDSDAINTYDLRIPFQSGKLKGKLPSILPATSGLCFTRSYLELILPMPEAESISISDNYLKFAALAIRKGLTINKKMAIQRIHGNNAFTLRGDKKRMAARIDIVTAYFIRLKFSFLSRYTNKLFASGLGQYWLHGGVELEFKGLVEKYFSSTTFIEKQKIYIRLFFNILFNYFILTRLKP
jgi:glycosyltransferase involved in cell wall biosynthesis